MTMRRTIVEGIYQDAHGISIVARIGSGPTMRVATARFPLVDPYGIPYSKKHCGELIKCRLQLLEDLRRQRATDGTAEGTLGAAIDAFLAAHPVVKGAASRKAEDYRYLLAHWRSSPLAALPIEAVTRAAVRDQLQIWTDAGLAPSTVNSRRQALTDVLRGVIEPEDADDIALLPTDKIPYVRPRELQARGLEIPIALRILATMPDRGRADKGEKVAPVNLTKVRLAVMLWTGMAHKSLMRLERRHVNFRDEKLYLPPRQKGKGSPGLWVDLLPQAVDALRAYDAAHLWGQPFSRSSMHKAWRRAVTNTRAALAADGNQTLLEQFDVSVPPNCRPYDLRHTFGTDVVRKTGDIRAAQALLQHQDIKTTERYIKAAVPERVAAAIDKMRAHWAPDAPPKGAASVRDFHVIPKTGA
jgi:integrase